MRKHIIMVAVAGLVIGGAAGYLAPHGAAVSAARGQFTQGQFAGRTGAAGAARGGFGGGTMGEVISFANGTLTLKTADGGTKLVLVGTSTPILTTKAGSAADLSVGANVLVVGSGNSDGSITAQSVQVRPAGMQGYGAPHAQGQ